MILLKKFKFLIPITIEDSLSFLRRCPIACVGGVAVAVALQPLSTARRPPPLLCQAPWSSRLMLPMFYPTYQFHQRLNGYHLNLQAFPSMIMMIVPLPRRRTRWCLEHVKIITTAITSTTNYNCPILSPNCSNIDREASASNHFSQQFFFITLLSSDFFHYYLNFITTIFV